jgi:proline racemase
MNLCGTGTFALGTALCETGMLSVSTSPVELTIEIPVGLQHLSIEVADGMAQSVTTRVSPAFFHGDCRVRAPEFGEVPFTLAFGINCLEPLIDCDAIGIELVPENVDRLVRLARLLKGVLSDPGQMNFGQLTGVQLSFYQNTPEQSGVDYRCMAIVGDGNVDTTPSGTSTCAHLAARFARGELKVGEEITVESITGARLTGRVAGETRYKDRPAVIPEISGSGTIRRLQTIIA